METVLITGANRGIGLEFVRQYLEAGNRVIACAREPVAANALSRLARDYRDRTTLFPLDVRKPEQIASLVRELGDMPVDILINNAGIATPSAVSLTKLNRDAWADAFLVNTIAPAMLSAGLLPNILGGRRRLIVMISSRLGSIGEGGDGYLGYRASKAALNSVTRTMAAELGDRGVTVIALHPGWVRTDMGGTNAAISPSGSVSDMRQVLGRAGPGDSGRFLGPDGRDIPW